MSIESQQQTVDFINDFFIGISSGIIASAILYYLSRFYQPDSLKNIKNKLELAQHYIYQIESSIEFPEDYEKVVHAFEKLYENLFQIYLCITPAFLMFRPINKKIMITLLYDMMCCCEASMFRTVGYSGEDEFKARLQKIKAYLQLHFSSMSALQIELLICKELIKNPARNAFEYISNTYAITHFEKMIDCNSFKQGLFFSEIREKGISKDKYGAFIKTLNLHNEKE